MLLFKGLAGTGVDPQKSRRDPSTASIPPFPPLPLEVRPLNPDRGSEGAL